MNRATLSNISIYFVVGIFVLTPSFAMAKATNVNEVNTLFEDHIDGKDEYFRSLEEIKGGATGRMQEGSANQYIHDRDKIEGFNSRIGSIDAYDLGEEGKKVRASEEYRFYDEHKMAPDWSKDGNRMHKVDAETITTATARKLNNLMKHLKDLGLDYDCSKRVKPVEYDVAYSLEIERNPQQNVEFDQILCEEARNQFNCKDRVTLTCKRKGINWTDWEQKEMPLNGVWIYRAHMGWFYPKKWTDSRYGLLLREGNPGVQAEMRAHIAANEGVPLENIHEHVSFGGRGEGRTVHADKNMYAFEVYKVHYNLRSGEEICEEWEEDWDERCGLK